MSSKSKGPLLTSREKGDLSQIPGVFRAASKIKTTDEGVPNDVPLPATGPTINDVIEVKHIDRQTPELKERIITLDQPSWPVVDDYYTDPVEEIVVKVEKTIVPFDQPYPGGFAERTRLDDLRSIQIVSSVDCDTLPPDETYHITTDLRLPDLLLEVGMGWSDQTSASANEQSNVSGDRGGASAFAEVSTSSDGSIYTRILGGFRGAVAATMVRSFHCGPPGTIITPTIIIPVTGTATVLSRAASASLGQGTESDQNSNSEAVRTHVASIGPVLTGSFIITGASHTAPPVSAFAEAEDDDGSIFQVTALANGLESTLVVQMPTSTPTQFFPGDLILVAVNVQKWRFGIFIQELIYAIVPNIPTS
jgi:hypothetical protein